MTQTAYIIQAVFDIVMLAVLIFAAIGDVKTRIVSPVYQIIILGLAVLHTVFEFVFVGKSEGFNCLFSGLAMFALYLIMVTIFPGTIGGADTKVTSCLTMYLGMWQTVGLMLYHAASALSYTVYMKLAKHKTIVSVPLMLYLAIGFTATKITWWIVQIL